MKNEHSFETTTGNLDSVLSKWDRTEMVWLQR